MGIDAEMLVRIKGRERWASAEDVYAAAHDIETALGRRFSPLRLALEKLPEPEWNIVPFPIKGGPDEQFIQVNLLTRYYSGHHTRGDWLFIRDVADWLKQRVPNGEVWYGANGGEYDAVPFEQVRDEIDAVFVEIGRPGYY
jgi:hypothetical protein